jgi:hypothetical protein
MTGLKKSFDNLHTLAAFPGLAEFTSLDGQKVAPFESGEYRSRHHNCASSRDIRLDNLFASTQSVAMSPTVQNAAPHRRSLKFEKVRAESGRECVWSTHAPLTTASYLGDLCAIWRSGCT